MWLACSSFESFGLSVGLWGLQMCCNGDGVSFCGREEKNKINSSNLRLTYHLRFFFSLVANGWYKWSAEL
jgi:hypothetical protein